MRYPKHLLQSDMWAEFRRAWGTTVIKAGNAQFTTHPIPYLPWKIGYMPRVYPEDINWEECMKKAREEHCVFVKIEPNAEKFTPPSSYRIVPAKNMFAHATYLIDLHKSEEELLSRMHPKTRYNIRLAAKKGVTVKVGHTEQMLEDFLTLFHETEQRQRFFNHPDKYYKTLFSIFLKHKSVQLVIGYYEGKPLAAMMLLFNGDTMFYPYGGSTQEYKEKMAFYLVMWEAIRFGKKNGYRYFDMWNCLLPEEETSTHPWYGFHRFKKGFNGELIRFCGAYDLVLQPVFYPVVLSLNTIRWIVLKVGLALKTVIKR